MRGRNEAERGDLSLGAERGKNKFENCAGCGHFTGMKAFFRGVYWGLLCVGGLYGLWMLVLALF